MKKAFVFIVLLIALAGGAYILLPYFNTQEATQGKEPQETDVKVTNVYIREESETHAIDVTYPQFGLLAIDAQIRDMIENAVAEFRAIPVGPPGSVAGQYIFEGTFDAVYVGPDVVSVTLILSQYTGGAHPLTLISGLNYDRATGRQLLQYDAFEMLGMTVEEVSADAATELKAKLGDAMFEGGANTNPENFSSFSISADAITFIFQQYQVAAYAAGPQEVSFDREK